MTVEKLNDQIQYTKYEIARMIGGRALQIAMGAPFLIKLSKKDIEDIHFNPVKIAQLEFEKGILPITVKRPLPEKKKK